MKTLSIPLTVALVCASFGCSDEVSTEHSPAAAAWKTDEILREPVAPASILLSLERTPCYGSCPAYLLRIHGDGRVEWDGRVLVQQAGRREGTIEPAAVAFLLRRMREIHAFDLTGDYVEMVTDLDFANFSLHVGEHDLDIHLHTLGERFDSFDQHEDPAWRVKLDLIAFGKAMDAMARSWRWADTSAEENGAQIATLSEVPGDFLVELARSWSDKSPEYRVTIDASGRGRWQGVRYVHELGHRSFEVPREDVLLLANRLQSATSLEGKMPQGDVESPRDVELRVRVNGRELRRSGTSGWRASEGPWQHAYAEYAAVADLIDVIARTEFLIGAWDDRGAW